MNLSQQYNVQSVDEINAQVEAYISEIIQELLLKVAEADNLLEQEKFEALIREINRLLDEMNTTLMDIIPEQTILNYFGAIDNATQLLAEAGVNVTVTSAFTASGQIAQGFQRKIHMEAVENIAADAMMDMNAAIRTAKMSANNAIGRVLEDVRGQIAKGLIQGSANKVVSKRVMETFLKEGMTAFVTSDNRKLPLDFYARTVVRTKSRESNTIGHINRYIDAGVGLLQIDERGDSCIKCAPYDGMVVSLTGNHEGFRSTGTVELPPYHPNCRGSVRPYVEEFKTASEMEEQRKKWENFNPEEDTRTPQERREYEKQQAIRRKSNEEKKQFMRWQSTLGAENFKTLGAFRRAKRENSPKYQELLAEYRSIAQQSS